MNKHSSRSFINCLSPATTYPTLPTQLLHINQGFWILSPTQSFHSWLPLCHLRIFSYPTSAYHLIHLFIHSVTDSLIAYCDPSNVLGTQAQIRRTHSLLALTILLAYCFIWDPVSLCTWFLCAAASLRMLYIYNALERILKVCAVWLVAIQFWIEVFQHWVNRAGSSHAHFWGDEDY